LKDCSLTLLAVSLFALAVFFPRNLPAQTYSESVLYSFARNQSGVENQNPGSLVMDSAGNLYGTTAFGGSLGDGCYTDTPCGTIFELSSKGVFSTLHKFRGGSGGYYPFGLVVNASGELYGFTLGGSFGSGTLFEFATKTKKFTTLYEFGETPTASAYPQGFPTIDSAGNLFGAAQEGGTNVDCPGVNGLVGCGTIFEITPKGVASIVYSFANTGFYPYGNLLLNDKGDFYGISFNAAGPAGSLYEVTSAGAEITLNSGVGAIDPNGYLSRDAAGNFYGGFSYAGTTPESYFSGIWEILDNSYKLSELYLAYDCVPLYFGGSCNSLIGTIGPLALSNGMIYGTADTGGPSASATSLGSGAVFEFSESTGAELTLYNFCSAVNCTDGSAPQWGVIADAQGNLFGTTVSGGAKGWGTIFKLTKD
jgi:uncharacterized repeat protein (TIGR03803 family)